MEKIATANRKKIETIDDWVDVNIPKELKEGYLSWYPTDDFILNMKPTNAPSYDEKAYVGRFSFNPKTKEFLPARISTSHASTIHQFGKSLYNKYTRGIYIRDKQTILIRPYYYPLDENGVFDPNKHYNPELDHKKTWETIHMLARNGFKPHHKIIIKANNDLVKEYLGLFV